IVIICFSFQDFLNILSKVSRGSIDEKLQWVFNLYDLNGDGLITKAEMVDVVTSIYEMLGRATQPAVEDSSAKDHVEKIFTMIDTNKDGAITIDELINWCSRDENFFKIFGNTRHSTVILYTRILYSLPSFVPIQIRSY
ncbi:hypothetical protein NQ314_009126, partial [Rhamnusium bicolor]